MSDQTPEPVLDAPADQTVDRDNLGTHDSSGERLRPTFTDATGVERIAGPPVENWEPAQVEPTDEQVARMAEHNAREAERRDARLDALTNTDRVGETAQPLVEANQAAADEHEAAKETTDVTPETPTDPTSGGTVDPTQGGVLGGTTATPPAGGGTDGAPFGTGDQQELDAAAVAAADADVARQVADYDAQQAGTEAANADAALAAAEAKDVADTEGRA